MDLRKILCYAVGCVVAVYLLSLILPYLINGLALIGAWYLIEEYYKNKKGRF